MPKANKLRYGTYLAVLRSNDRAAARTHLGSRKNDESHAWQYVVPVECSVVCTMFEMNISLLSVYAGDCVFAEPAWTHTYTVNTTRWVWNHPYSRIVPNTPFLTRARLVWRDVPGYGVVSS